MRPCEANLIYSALRMDSIDGVPQAWKDRDIIFCTGLRKAVVIPSMLLIKVRFFQTAGMTGYRYSQEADKAPRVDAEQLWNRLDGMGVHPGGFHKAPKLADIVPSQSSR